MIGRRPWPVCFFAQIHPLKKNRDTPLPQVGQLLRSSQTGRLLRLLQLTFAICNRSEQMCAKYRTRPTHEKFQLFQSGRTGMDYRTERIWKFFIFYFRMPDSPVANDHYHSILHTFCFSCCSAIIFLSGNEKVRVVFS